MAAIQKRKVGDVYYLYLDYSENGKRKQESLKIKMLIKPSSVAEKAANRDAERRANGLKAAKEMELNGYKSGLVSNEGKNIDIIKGFEEWADAYKKQDNRSALQASAWFQKYCDEMGKIRLNSSTAVVSFFDEYGQWLNSQTVTTGMRARGHAKIMAKETRIKIFRKLRTYLIKIFKDGYLSWPPQMITAKWKRDVSIVKKSTLKGAELEHLLTIDMPHRLICSAWIFCINTGLDYNTVCTIQWDDISDDGFLNFIRRKTQKGNKIRMNKTALSCLPQGTADHDHIFPLPTHPTCLKWIRRWLKTAEIPNADTFTWHSARHNLGMILGNEKNVPPAVLKEIYGHSDIKETLKYYKAYDQVKDEAMDKIG